MLSRTSKKILKPAFASTTRGFAQVSDHLPSASRLPLLEDLPEVSEKHTPIFTVSKKRGFLPRLDPVVGLPNGFEAAESLLQRMTIIQKDGSQGLLATGQFAEAVRKELDADQMVKRVEDLVENGSQAMLSAAFRDWCFLTSSYLLEPVDQSYRKTGLYAPGNSVLPRALAVPIKKLADKLGHFPFMEYASSYALANYRLKDAQAGYDFENLELIRAFESHAGSEKGFILVHVEMVSKSWQLVTAAEDMLNGGVGKDRATFNKGLSGLLAGMRAINESMETMWKRSAPEDYLRFRSFIFGTAPAKLNAMFPEGVIYEGVSDEPMSFRGESGANDSIIPLADNLLEITKHHPDNALRDVLRDFRKYRPAHTREYIETLERRASDATVRDFAMSDPESAALYILNVDQVREFRDRHWRFTKQYIIERTNFGLATGGSNILSYLPNNLATVLRVLDESCDEVSMTQLKTAGVNSELIEGVEACRHRAQVQRRVLDREVEQLKESKQGKGDGMLHSGKPAIGYATSA